jgi:hypothetical protein
LLKLPDFAGETVSVHHYNEVVLALGEQWIPAAQHGYDDQRNLNLASSHARYAATWSGLES